MLIPSHGAANKARIRVQPFKRIWERRGLECPSGRTTSSCFVPGEKSFVGDCELSLTSAVSVSWDCLPFQLGDSEVIKRGDGRCCLGMRRLCHKLHSNRITDRFWLPLGSSVARAISRRSGSDNLVHFITSASKERLFCIILTCQIQTHCLCLVLETSFVGWKWL
jgi:hypothetical protein